MNNLLKFWKFLWNHLLTKMWFWVTTAVAAILTLCGYWNVPFLGTVLSPLGQVVLGIVACIFLVPLAWLIVLTLSSGGRSHSIPWRNIGLVILLLVGSIWYFRYYLPEQKAEEAKLAQQAADDRLKALRQQSGEEPLRSCTTPCTIEVGPGQHPKWPEQHPIDIKFVGMDWIHVPAIGTDQFVFSQKYDMSKFQAGDGQQFASPEGLPLVVNVYAH